MTIHFTPYELNCIKLRYENEPTSYVAYIYNVNVETLRTVAKKNNWVKKPLSERIFSVQYLSYKYNISENDLYKINYDLKLKTSKFVKIKYKLTKEVLGNIIKTFNVKEKTFNVYSTEELYSIFDIDKNKLSEIKYNCIYKKMFSICKMFNITESAYYAIMNSFDIQYPECTIPTPIEFMKKYNLTKNDMNNAEIYLYHFSNRIYSNKFNINISTVAKIREYLNIQKLPTSEQLCSQCMTNYRTEGYRSIHCKTCHTKNMSEYQKVYYPLKIEKIKSDKIKNNQNLKDIIKLNSKPVGE